MSDNFVDFEGEFEGNNGVLEDQSGVETSTPVRSVKELAASLAGKVATASSPDEVDAKKSASLPRADTDASSGGQSANRIGGTVQTF